MDNNSLAEGERDAATMAVTALELVLMLRLSLWVFYCCVDHFPADRFIERASRECFLLRLLS